jgi:hypothetical protein
MHDQRTTYRHCSAEYFVLDDPSQTRDEEQKSHGRYYNLKSINISKMRLFRTCTDVISFLSFVVLRDYHMNSNQENQRTEQFSFF